MTGYQDVKHQVQAVTADAKLAEVLRHVRQEKDVCREVEAVIVSH